MKRYKKHAVLVGVFLLCVLFGMLQKPFYKSDVPQGLMNIDPKNPLLIIKPETKRTSSTTFELAREYAGEKIISPSILQALAAAQRKKYATSEEMLVTAYQYGKLVHATFSGGEGGYYVVFVEEDGVYKPLARGNDAPMCDYFKGYDVPKGLLCRVGGCFSDETTLINKPNDCFRSRENK